MRRYLAEHVKRRLSVPLFVTMFVILVPVAAAGETKFEGSAGYSVSRYGNIQPVGWFVSIAAKPTDWFAIASELTAEYHTDTTTPRPTKQSGFVFVDGPRFIHAMSWNAVVFGEVLVGIAHGREFIPGETRENRFVWQPGAGIDVKLSERLAARFHVVAMSDSWEFDSTRFLSGLVITGRPSRAEKARLDQLQKDRNELRRAKHDADMADAEARKAKALADKEEAEARRRAATRATAPSAP